MKAISVRLALTSWISRRCYSTAILQTRVISLQKSSTFSLNLIPTNSPLVQCACFKSQGKKRTSSVKSESLSEDLKRSFNEGEMLEEYAKVVTKFKSNLCRKLCLKHTPEHFFSIPLQGEQVLLGEVASIVVQNSAQASTNQPTAHILIDLSGRPDLVPAAKLAISQFLLTDKTSKNSRHSKSNTDNSDIINAVSQTQFTVKLRTVVTGEIRNELTKQGRDMLHDTKKEMDRIYQKFTRSLNPIKSLSEDDKRLAVEYIKSVIKHQHTLVEDAWKKKEHELLNE